MSNMNRLDVFPSLANQVVVESQILAATKNFKLLKLKRAALKIKLREAVKERAVLANSVNKIFAEAIFSIAKANFLETDFKPAVIIGSNSADVWLQLTYTNTMGLSLPKFEPILQKSESLPFTGLSHGGEHVEFIRDKFQEALRPTILLGSLNNSVKTMETAIRTSRTRLNALENVIIPRLKNTATYLKDELSEQNRMEFYRLKHALCGKLMFQINAEYSLNHRQRANCFMVLGLSKKIEDDESVKDKDVVDVESDVDKSVQFTAFPMYIYTKKKSSSAAQTLITGHFPDSREFISPTDSVISGSVPTILKRPSYKVSKINVMLPRPKHGVIKEEDVSKNFTDDLIDNLYTQGSDATLGAREASSAFLFKEADTIEPKATFSDSQAPPSNDNQSVGNIFDNLWGPSTSKEPKIAPNAFLYREPELMEPKDAFSDNQDQPLSILAENQSAENIFGNVELPSSEAKLEVRRIPSAFFYGIPEKTKPKGTSSFHKYQSASKSSDNLEIPGGTYSTTEDKQASVTYLVPQPKGILGEIESTTSVGSRKSDGLDSASYLTTETMKKHEMSVQTDISGRCPDTDELDLHQQEHTRESESEVKRKQ